MLCCPLWASIVKEMTAIDFHPEGKHCCQCCAASPTFTGSVGIVCILDKVSHRGHALSSIASSVSSVIDIMSIKKFIIPEELNSDSIGHYLELPALSSQYFLILHVNQVQS